MKHLVAIVLMACGIGSAWAETNVGVSIGIVQPGVYGRIDIGNFPQPAVIYSQPVYIAPQPVVVRPQPVYLYVAPEHRRHWSRYCSHYGACAQPVYFVRESWVSEQYHKQRGKHGNGHGHGKGHKERKD